MIDKELILSKLEHVRGNGVRYRCKCPARDHSSGNSTLSLLFNPDGRLLIHCFGGCEANEVLNSIGYSLTDLYPDGAIRDFMAAAKAPPKKQNQYETWIEVMDRQRGKLKKGERFTNDTLELAKEMYRKSKQ